MKPVNKSLHYYIFVTQVLVECKKAANNLFINRDEGDERDGIGEIAYCEKHLKALTRGAAGMPSPRHYRGGPQLKLNLNP